MFNLRHRFEQVRQTLLQRDHSDEQYAKCAIRFRLAMKHREIDAVGIEPQLLARGALGDERAHGKCGRHEDPIAKRVLFEFTLDEPRIDSGIRYAETREFLAQDFILKFDVRRTAVAYRDRSMLRLRRSMALQTKAGQAMENVARSEPLRHPSVERLDHRN